jgi:Ca-activated chloride channel family protein
MTKGSWLIAAALAAGQISQPAFRTRADLVAMNVTVVDAQGGVVRGLTQDAFTISEDGQPRSIAQFTAESAPLSLVVAVDASSSMQGRRFAFARETVLKLLDRLGPDDELFVFGFNQRLFNIVRGTRDRDAIARALADVHPNGLTALYDAVSAGVQALRVATHRRQALIVISDGNDHMVDPYRDDRRPVAAREASAIEIARRSEAVIYAIGVNSGPGSSERLDVAALGRLTMPTGGSATIVTSDDGVIGAAEQIGENLRHQYVIGFAPAHPGDGKFHRVQVTVSTCEKCRTRARSGFIAEK